jgi:hypothetical protein
MDHADLDNLIDDLARATKHLKDPRPDWRGTWALVKQIGASFRGMRYPSRSEHEAAWTRFQTLVSDVRRLSEEGRKRDAERVESSERLRNRIASLAEAATPPNEFERGVAAVVEMTFGKPLIKALVDALPGPPADEEKLLLERCSKALAQGFRELGENKALLTRGDKDAAYAALVEAKERLDAAWARWKGLQQQQYEARQARREERQEKHDDWRERTRARIERLESRCENLTAIIAKKERHLKDLEEKRQQARSEEHRDRVDGWIAEEVASISDLKGQLREVRSRLEAERETL